MGASFEGIIVNYTLEHEILTKKAHMCYYVMPVAEYGELFRFVEHSSERLSERLVRTLFTQLLLGMHYLHLKGIAHRDLKPENLLLTDEGKLMIADFGFATGEEKA